MQVTPDILIYAIKILMSILGAVTLLFCTLIGILHRGITSRLDLIEQDLKPLATSVAILNEKVHDLQQFKEDATLKINLHHIKFAEIEAQLGHKK